MRRIRKTRLKSLAHSVNLSFNGIASNGPTRPTFGHHGTKPDVIRHKQTGFCGVIRAQRQTVQTKVRRARNGSTVEHSLELRTA